MPGVLTIPAPPKARSATPPLFIIRGATPILLAMVPIPTGAAVGVMEGNGAAIALPMGPPIIEGMLGTSPPPIARPLRSLLKAMAIACF